MSRNDKWWKLNKHELKKAKADIEAYYVYKKAIAEYENTSNGYDELLNQETIMRKTGYDIDDYAYNIRIVKDIEDSFKDWTSLEYQDVLWDYIINGKKAVDEFTESVIKTEFRKWCYGFAKIHGYKTT